MAEQRLAIKRRACSKFINKKNIYWNYREETATVQWLDDHTVLINKHKLNVETDTYDFRKTKEERANCY